ncbi:MAG: anaerobic ribonucleoside-triphosphate reductase activating protein [Sphaerochaetaceae bacterium]
MNIAAVEKISLLDYPKVVSALVFTQGCNYDCFYCHNRLLIAKHKKDESQKTLEFLKKRIGKLQGVVITGGEPTIQSNLIPFITECKNLGYLIKLDTNGSNPQLLKELIADNLLDYVALDVKTTANSYKEVCGLKADYKKVENSLNILKRSKLEWEVRTTLYPTMTLTDSTEISQQIKEVPLWRLNLYRIPILYKKGDEMLVNSRALSKSEVTGYFENYKGKYIIA